MVIRKNGRSSSSINSEPTKYGGSSTDNWTDFESLFRSIVEVTGIANAQRVGFLKLHLKDSALQFFHTLDQNTRTDLKLTVTVLKSRFCNPNLKEIHHINLENMKFNHKTESPEEFLVKLQNLALKVYPTPVDIPVAPVDGDVPNDQDRFDRETRENHNSANRKRKTYKSSLQKSNAKLHQIKTSGRTRGCNNSRIVHKSKTKTDSQRIMSS